MSSNMCIITTAMLFRHSMETEAAFWHNGKVSRDKLQLKLYWFGIRSCKPHRKRKSWLSHLLRVSEVMHVILPILMGTYQPNIESVKLNKQNIRAWIITLVAHYLSPHVIRTSRKLDLTKIISDWIELGNFQNSSFQCFIKFIWVFWIFPVF